ncbi:hypothetical protein L9F63_019228, partial [Diploptera punctata]
ESCKCNMSGSSHEAIHFLTKILYGKNLIDKRTRLLPATNNKPGFVCEIQFERKMLSGDTLCSTHNFSST